MASRSGDPEIEQADALVGADDPSPVRIANADGRSLFLLLGDHAGNAVPASLGTLGLSGDELSRHIALDIGIHELGAELAGRLDAPFIEQHYSRLVVDCNRAPEAVDAVAAVSDGTAIPGNTQLSEADRASRYSSIFEPYHAAIAKLLQDRDAAGLNTTIVSLHSFTPSLAGSARPWTIGVLHDAGNTRFAVALLRVLRDREGEKIGDNAPYRMDATDYTVPRHAYPDRPYAELEVRQDLLASPAGRQAIADLLADALQTANAAIAI
ncbi:MAG: N-formylglutamate amidohydrolase [Novosphingobium sp.]